MAYNFDLHKQDIKKITKTDFKKAIFLCYKGGITSRAPLGFSGDTIMLHGTPNDFETRTRRNYVSIRNYCNHAELLITDDNGNFLFYGRFDINFGIDFVVNQYWEIFNKVKPFIKTTLPRISDFNVLDADVEDCLEEFNLINYFQKSHY